MPSRVLSLLSPLFLITPVLLGQTEEDCVIEVGDFRTQTQGGWGADECSGGNPACTLQALFDVAFPEGVTLGGGCPEGVTWTFTTAKAVSDFLPAGSTPALLPGDAVNPIEGGSVLAGQLLALKLSLGFDAANPDFGASPIGLEDLLFASGPYAGWTLGGLVQWADLIIGGCAEPDMDLPDLTAVLAQVNEAFVDGTTVSGVVVLPGCLEGGPETTCSVALECPAPVALDCGQGPTVDVTGLPQAVRTCCPVGSGGFGCLEELLPVEWTWTDVYTGTSPVTLERTFSGFALGTTGVALLNCTQTIALADGVAPEVQVACPADTMVALDAECAGTLPAELGGFPLTDVTDDLDANPQVIIMFEDDEDAPCNGQVILTRTWTVKAIDACGNTAVETCSQTITLVDDSAPEFGSTCGLADGDVIEVCCSPEGTVDLPDVCIVSVSDNCGATVTYTEEATGYAPMNGAVQACAATQPDAVGAGLTCEGDTVHALRLFCFPGSDEQFALFSAVGAGDIQYADDASWSLSWTVTSLRNPNAGFDIEATFSDGLDWAGWNARGIPSGYKGACATADQAQDWMYFLLSAGTMTGWGDYAGSQFTLSHQPASTFYGTQVGLGANQHNGGYGFGSTLTYQGTLVEQGQIVAEDLHCCGDMHGDIECCLPFVLTRTYTATDCAGNTSTFSYAIVSDGGACPDGAGTTAERTMAADPLRGGGTATDPGQPEIEGTLRVAPNPATGAVRVDLEPAGNARLSIDLLDLSGSVISSVMVGRAEAGVPVRQAFDVSGIPPGFYQLRVEEGAMQRFVPLVVR